MARSTGGAGLLARVLVRSGNASQSMDTVERFVTRFEEAVAGADEVGDPALRVLARMWLGVGLLTIGATRRAADVVEQMVALSTEASPTVRWICMANAARSHLLAGRLVDAEKLNDEGLVLAQDIGEPDGLAWWAAITGAVQYVKGEFGSMADPTGAFADEYPGAPTWRTGQAQALAWAGRHDEARALMGRYNLGSDMLLDDPLPLTGAFGLADMAYFLGDAEVAARCFDELRPYQNYWAHYCLGVLGPASSAMGMAACTIGRFDESVELLKKAVASVEAAGCVGLWPVIALRLAEVLVTRDRNDDKARSLFTRRTHCRESDRARCASPCNSGGRNHPSCHGVKGATDSSRYSASAPATTLEPHNWQSFTSRASECHRAKCPLDCTLARGLTRPIFAGSERLRMAWVPPPLQLPVLTPAVADGQPGGRHEPFGGNYRATTGGRFAEVRHPLPDLGAASLYLS